MVCYKVGEHSEATEVALQGLQPILPVAEVFFWWGGKKQRKNTETDVFERQLF